MAGERDREDEERDRDTPERGGGGRTPTPSGGRPGPRRFPGWILVPLGGLAGWVVSGWMGAAFGALLGGLLWQTRA